MSARTWSLPTWCRFWQDLGIGLVHGRPFTDLHLPAAFRQQVEQPADLLLRCSVFRVCLLKRGPDRFGSRARRKTLAVLVAPPHFIHRLSFRSLSSCCPRRARCAACAG